MPKERRQRRLRNRPLLHLVRHLKRLLLCLLRRLLLRCPLLSLLLLSLLLLSLLLRRHRHLAPELNQPRNRLQNRNRPQNQLQPQSQLRQHRLPGQLSSTESTGCIVRSFSWC